MECIYVLRLLAIVLLGNVFVEGNVYPECIRNPSDIVFLLDGSGSVGNHRFTLIKEFVESLLTRLNVGNKTTRVGLMQFSGSARTVFEFELNDYSDVKSIKSAIQEISYHYGGLQETGFAMKMIRKKAFNGSEVIDRPWARNVIVLLAEGPSTYPDKAFKEAKELGERGEHIVTIGVGNRIALKQFKNELISLASSPEDVYFAKDDDLMALGDRLGLSLCPNKTTPSSSAVQSTTMLPSTPSIGSSTGEYFRTHHVTIEHTLTKIITSYVLVPSTCAEVPASSSSPSASSSSVVTISKAKNIKSPSKEKEIKKVKSRKLSGKQHKCYSCEYDQAVATEFGVKCSQEKCNAGQHYCADAILEHQNRRFTKKTCALKEMCNSTKEECVEIFQHTGDFSDCRVDCCEGKLCNPYSGSPMAVQNLLLCSLVVLFVFAYLL